MAKHMYILLVLMFTIYMALSTRYEWNEDWRVVNDGNLKELRAGQGYGTFRLMITPSGSPLTSDNGTIGLAFLNFNTTGKYYMSLMLGVETGAALPIWTANRNSPLSEGCHLELRSGQMRLVDSQGNRIWGPYRQLVKGFELSEDGNFRLFDDQNTTLWQSFDNPTDILMPGQQFRTGNDLVSNSAKSSVAQGIFVTVVEASGLALYMTSQDSTQPPQAYSISTMQNTTVKRLLSTVLHECPGYHTLFSYNGADFELEYEANDNSTNGIPCAHPRKVHFPTVNDKLRLRFLRLEYTGDLVSYGYDPEKLNWEADFSWMSLVEGKVCSYPVSCGLYGLCQVQGTTCKCFSNKTQEYDLDSDQACPATPQVFVLQDTCDSYKSKQHRFINIPGASYLPTRLLQPDIVSESLDQCLNMCMSNCSCAAVFYQKNSSACFFEDEILGSLDFDPAAAVQYSAHLKMVNIPEGGSRSPSKLNNRAKLAIVTSGIGIVLVGFFSILFLIWFRRRRWSKEAVIIKSLLDALPGATPHRFSYKTLKLATKAFTQKLGSGGFGSVYAGVLSDGRRLAIKNLETHTRHSEKEFIAEVVSLGSISHVNIVRLCGYCVHGSSKFLVYEHVANGSLDKWLFSEMRTDLTWQRRWNIALGTARALVYLHEECRDPILHLDIKPQNILLDEDFTVKVADFGLSKLLSDRDITQVVTGVRGTPGYIAPEWLLNSRATKKCDVYSYGMLLLELLSGRRNTDPMIANSSSSGWYFPPWAVDQVKQGRTMDAVDKVITSEKGTAFEVVERLFRIALWCIQDNPSMRPSMSTVVQMLEGHCDVSQPPLVYRFQQQQEQETHAPHSSTSELLYEVSSMSIEAR